MKEFCYPSTKSTNNKIKQFFSDLGFVSSFFFPLLLKLLPFFSGLMENRPPEFEPLDEDFQACKTSFSQVDEESCEMNQNQRVAINGDNHSKTQSENPHASRHESEKHTISHSLSDLGSTRREKEWRRTLACKLFQERNNSSTIGGGGGEEGMDKLWEVYEKTEEETRGKQRGVPNGKEEESKRNKSRIVDYLEEVDEEEGEEANLCCLKALKFSAGKINFGMAKPGILNFSRAFKGIKPAWFKHRYQRNRSKKV